MDAASDLRDLLVIVDDQPGVLHRMIRVLAQSAVRVDGLSVRTSNGRAVIHLLVRQHEEALLALKTAGWDVHACRHTVIRDISDGPEALAAVLEPLENAGVNVELAYLGVGSRTNTCVVLVVDDPEVARLCLRTVP